MTGRKIIFGFATAISALILFATPALAKEWSCNKGTECQSPLIGQGQQVFKEPEHGLTVECRTSEGQARLKSPSRELQIKEPKYTTCTSTITGAKHKAEVKFAPLSECGTRLVLNEGESGSKQQGKVTLKSKTCKGLITVAGTACEIEINGEQGPLEKFRAEQVLNEKTKEREVHIKAEVQNITAHYTAGCGVTAGNHPSRYKGSGRIEHMKVR